MNVRIGCARDQGGIKRDAWRMLKEKAARDSGGNSFSDDGSDRCGRNPSLLTTAIRIAPDPLRLRMTAPASTLGAEPRYRSVRSSVTIPGSPWNIPRVIQAEFLLGLDLFSPPPSPGLYSRLSSRGLNPSLQAFFMGRRMSGFHRLHHRRTQCAVSTPPFSFSGRGPAVRGDQSQARLSGDGRFSSLETIVSRCVIRQSVARAALLD